MLEESGLPYDVVPVDIGEGEQKKSTFTEISPSNKIPAIIDDDGPNGHVFSAFESNAILLYLAEKSDLLLSKDPVMRSKTMQWLFFQAAHVGAIFGQAHHFRRFSSIKSEYAIERMTAEVRRSYGILDRQLESTGWIVGDYSIADIACYPWIVFHEWCDIDLAEFPSVQDWFARVSSRPGVQRGMDIPTPQNPDFLK